MYLKRFFFMMSLSLLIVSCGEVSEQDVSENVSEIESEEGNNQDPSLDAFSKDAITLTQSGKLLAPAACSEKFGAGGNYSDGKNFLRGKCQGNFATPAIKGKGKKSYLEFKTKKAKKASEKDRVELAWSAPDSFKKTTTIKMKVRIPSSSDVTNEHFSLMQMWQCPGEPPIAGVRVKRGTSHTLQFYARGSTKSGSATKAKFEMKPDKWHNFVIKMKVKPKGNGLFKIIADGKTIKTWKGPYGYAGKNFCIGAVPESFRTKFGIYKGSEPGKAHEVHYQKIEKK